MRTPLRHLQTYATLIALVAFAWGGIVAGSFQYDDFANILTDPATFELPALLERLTSGIRPLTRLTYGLSAWSFGEWAGGWLLFNGLLHVATTLGVAKLVKMRAGNTIAAALAGACFALQPANAMVVAYVSGRSTALATALLVAALIAHEHGRADPLARTRWNAIALLAFALACAAKEVALIFPVLVLVWESARPIGWRAAMHRAAPYAYAAVVLCVTLLAASPRYRELLQFSLDTRSPLEAALHNIAALPATLSLWFRPWALSIEHAAPVRPLFTTLGAITLLTMLAIAAFKRSAVVTLALLWPLVALLPTHSLIAKLDAVSEGPLYLAWIGPSIALGLWASTRERHASVRALAVVLSVALTLSCHWRVHVWSDPVRLWGEATARVPASSRAWTNLGVAQLASGDRPAARTALRTALELDPANPRAMLNLELLTALNPVSRSDPIQ